MNTDPPGVCDADGCGDGLLAGVVPARGEAVAPGVTVGPGIGEGDATGDGTGEPRGGGEGNCAYATRVLAHAKTIANNVMVEKRRTRENLHKCHAARPLAV